MKLVALGFLASSFIYFFFFPFHFNLLLIIYFWYLKLVVTLITSTIHSQVNQNPFLSSVWIHVWNLGNLETSEPSGHTSITAVIPPKRWVIIKVVTSSDTCRYLLPAHCPLKRLCLDNLFELAVHFWQGFAILMWLHFWTFLFSNALQNTAGGLHRVGVLASACGRLNGIAFISSVNGFCIMNVNIRVQRPVSLYLTYISTSLKKGSRQYLGNTCGICGISVDWDGWGTELRWLLAGGARWAWGSQAL